LKPGLLFLSAVLPGNRNRRFNNREFPKTPEASLEFFRRACRELSAWAGEKHDFFPYPLNPHGCNANASAVMVLLSSYIDLPHSDVWISGWHLRLPYRR
jgi:hypothetical protein